MTHQLADWYSNAPVGSSVARVFIFLCRLTRCWEVHLFRERWCRAAIGTMVVCCLLSRATTRRALDKRARMDIFTAHTQVAGETDAYIIYCCLRPRDEIALWPISLWRAGASISLLIQHLCVSFEPLLSRCMRLFSIKVMNRVRPRGERDDWALAVTAPIQPTESG
jgi:hypothetical protein